MNRAYSILEIKSFDEDARTFEGIASTPSVDLGGDSMDPLGAEFKLPMPLMWQHGKGDIKDPVGWITHAAPNDKGIPVKGKFGKVDGPPGLKEQLDRAWALVKAKLVGGLSIGWGPIKAEPIKGTLATRWVKWSWHETSVVAMPMNTEATILSIKSADSQYLRAASGASAGSGVVRLSNLPGVSGLNSLETKGNAMNTGEQITAYANKRAATAAALAEIMKKSADSGETLDAETSQKYDEYKAELKTIDQHIERLKDYEKTVGATAQPVVQNTADPEPIKVKAGEGVLRVPKDLPPGIGMARYVKAFAFGRGNFQQAIEYAKQWDDSTPEVGLALKGAIAAGTTTDSVWAGPLVYATNFPAAFLDFLRPQTIMGKIPGMTQVPFNIRYGIQDGGSTVGWVGQGLGKPVSKLSFTSASMGFAKAAGIVVITQELARFSSPSAELLVRNDLAKQMIYFLDQQFIDPGVAAVANVSPASILNGASNVRQAAAAWTTMAAVLTDVYAFLSVFAANEIALNGAVWVMTPDVALRLSLILTTGGENFAFPGISVNGGTFAGFPVVVSNSVPHSTSAGSIVALVVPEHIYIADDGGIAIDQSTEASLLMDSAPTTQTSATPTGSSVVSMFQTNSIAIRVERIINWSRARAYGAGYIDNVHTS